MSNNDALACDITSWTFPAGCVCLISTQKFPNTRKVASSYVRKKNMQKLTGNERCGSAEIV